MFEYYIVIISDHYSLGFLVYFNIEKYLNILKLSNNTQPFVPSSAHISAHRARPELIVTEFPALSF